MSIVSRRIGLSTAISIVIIMAAATCSAQTVSTLSTLNPDGTLTNSVAYGDIEEMSGWYTYPDQGNPDCGSGPKLVSSPSLDGVSGKFYLGPHGEFNNCLWPIKLGSSTTATQFTLDAHYRLSNPAYSQGVEFSSNKRVGTQWYKFSVQCSYYKGIFSVWDTAGAKWVATAIPCKRPALGSWDHLTVKTAVSNGKAVFLSLMFNNVSYTINKSFSPSIQSGDSYTYGVHFQINGNRAGDPYYAWVDNFTFTVSTSPTLDSSNSETVTITSPADGGTYSGPNVNIAATASGPATIKAMALWVDYRKVYTESSSSLSHSQWFSTGKHRIVVQAIDSNGKSYSSTAINITVN